MRKRDVRRWAIALAAGILVVLFAIRPALANVTLSYFLATPGNRDGRIVVTWGTETEVDVAAFRLLRSTVPEIGAVELIHQAQPRGSATTGADYEFIDDGLEVGQRYYYWLGHVSNSGQETLLSLATQLAPGGDEPSQRWLFFPVSLRSF